MSRARRRAALLACALVPVAAAPVRAAAPSGCQVAAVLKPQELSPEAADRLRLRPSTLRTRRPGELRLGDGRLLVQDGPGAAGLLYLPSEIGPRERELQAALRLRQVAAGVPFHPLRGLIDDGARLVEQAPQRAAALTARVARELPKRDGAGPVEAAAVDAYLARWRAASCRPDPALTAELTAWLGGELLARLGPPARWSTRTVDGTVEPVIERAPPPAPPAPAADPKAGPAAASPSAAAPPAASAPPTPDAPPGGAADRGAGRVNDRTSEAAAAPLLPWALALRLIEDSEAKVDPLLDEAVGAGAAAATRAPAARP